MLKKMRHDLCARLLKIYASNMRKEQLFSQYLHYKHSEQFSCWSARVRSLQNMTHFDCDFICFNNVMIGMQLIDLRSYGHRLMQPSHVMHVEWPS